MPRTAAQQSGGKGDRLDPYQPEHQADRGQGQRIAPDELGLHVAAVGGKHRREQTRSEDRGQSEYSARACFLIEALE